VDAGPALRRGPARQSGFERQVQSSRSEGLADKLIDDDAEFWELLWHLITPQAAERNITADQFGKLMAANCLADARRLFFEEWADFFRQLHRPDKAATVEKWRNTWRRRSS
jgi:hypothetical protein